MKTTEELYALKNEVEIMNKKLAELNDDELQFVIGGLEVGGLNGRPNSGTIDNCYNSGDVTSGNNGDYAGGICGKNESTIAGKEGNPFIGNFDGTNNTVNLNIRP